MIPITRGSGLTADESNCGRSGGNWNGSSCDCPSGKELKEGRCVVIPITRGSGLTADESNCGRSGGTWSGSSCVCPVDKPRLFNGRCKACPGAKSEWDSIKRECVASAEQECSDKQGNWTWNNNAGACVCQAPNIQKGNNCRLKTKKEECEDKGANWTWKDGKCIECPKWKKHPAFKKNGKVSSGFCDEYAKNKGDCKRALSDLREYASDLKDLRDQLKDLKDELRSKSRSENESVSSSTEASGVCFDCLKRILRASQPSTGQVVGQSLGLLLGAGLSVAGYKAGTNAQAHANMMRIKQGYPSLYDGFSLAGAGAGYPFMANSLYGMTRASTPVGGWSCSPTVSPHGHVHGGVGYGYGHNMRYY